MINKVEVLWKELDLDNILASKHTRVKELLCLICCYSFCDSSNNLSNWEYLRENYKNIKNWIQELKEITGTNDRVERFCQTLDNRLEEIIDCKREEDYFLSPNLLELIEQYQTSPNIIQETNFHGITYYESHLTHKIDLLYKIGKETGILTERKIFNSSVRVDRDVQKTCDRVRAWVKDKLGFDLQRVNVYESFIGKYLKYCDRTFYEGVCEAALEEIGQRSGILIRDKREVVSRAETEIIIQWLQENYGIELPLPKSNTDFILPHEHEKKVSIDIEASSEFKNPFVTLLKGDVLISTLLLGAIFVFFVPDLSKTAEQLIEKIGLVGQSDRRLEHEVEELEKSLKEELRRQQLHPVSPRARSQ